jgi:hypothetical protein
MPKTRQTIEGAACDALAKLLPHHHVEYKYPGFIAIELDPNAPAILGLDAHGDDATYGYQVNADGETLECDDTPIPTNLKDGTALAQAIFAWFSTTQWYRKEAPPLTLYYNHRRAKRDKNEEVIEETVTAHLGRDEITLCGIVVRGLGTTWFKATVNGSYIANDATCKRCRRIHFKEV